MRLLALMVVAALWGTPALAESKAAPDGFGPIKFGMTKEEAWAAVGGKGEWIEEDELVYVVPMIGSMKYPFEVRQSFVDGLATSSAASSTQEDTYSSSCLMDVTILVGLISDVYDKVPIEVEEAENKNPTHISKRYIFVFQNGVFIKIDQSIFIGLESSSCNLSIFYRSPFPDDYMEQAVRGIL